MCSPYYLITFFIRVCFGEKYFRPLAGALELKWRHLSIRCPRFCVERPSTLLASYCSKATVAFSFRCKFRNGGLGLFLNLKYNKIKFKFAENESRKRKSVYFIHMPSGLHCCNLNQKAYCAKQSIVRKSLLIGGRPRFLRRSNFSCSHVEAASLLQPW